MIPSVPRDAKLTRGVKEQLEALGVDELAERIAALVREKLAVREPEARHEIKEMKKGDER